MDWPDRCNGQHGLEARRALAAGSAHPHQACVLANALWLDDELAEALSWARWATRALPGAEVHPMAWRALGNALLDLGRYEEAEQAYCRADPHEEDPGVCCNRSQVAQGWGQLAKAWRLAEARLLRSPPRVAARACRHHLE
jgi:tetratricopeptide (TPR) repeat protein